MALAGKAVLRKKLAEKLGIPLKQADAALDALLETMADELRQGNTVSLPEFLTLTAKPGKPLACRNPRTGERLFVRPLPSIRAAISKSLRAKVAGERAVHAVAYVPGLPDVASLLAEPLPHLRMHVVDRVEDAQALLMSLPVALLILDDGTPTDEYARLALSHKMQDAVVNPQLMGIAHGTQFTLETDEPHILPDFVVPAKAVAASADALAMALEQMIDATRATRLSLRARLLPTPEALAQAKAMIMPLVAQSFLKPESRDGFGSAMEEALDWTVERGGGHDGPVEIAYVEAAGGVTCRVDAEPGMFSPSDATPEQQRVMNFRKSIITHGSDEAEFADDGASLVLRKKA